MQIREQFEQQELEQLSPYASCSVKSRGRDIPETECSIRTCYQRDRDRIIHCKSFRRLKHKTQVFLSPEGDHYRTRLTHTLEVAQIARSIAKALWLNEELTEAIALGHDLGHTPFGHAGESVLNQAMAAYGRSFHHYEQSVRVVERLEKNGWGLNLTWEVRNGIRNHGTARMPVTLEGQVVRLCDKVAYINHDIDDAIRARVLQEKDIPAEYTDILGRTVHDRIDFLIHDMVANSAGKDHICQSEDAAKAMTGLRTFLFQEVYGSPRVQKEEQRVGRLLLQLFAHYQLHTELLPSEYFSMIEKGEPQEVVVCDYIAGMTDSYAVAKFEELFVPHAWTI